MSSRMGRVPPFFGRALIRVGKEGTEIRPIIDMTKVMITVSLSAVGVWRALSR